MVFKPLKVYLIYLSFVFSMAYLSVCWYWQHPHQPRNPQPADCREQVSHRPYVRFPGSVLQLLVWNHSTGEEKLTKMNISSLPTYDLRTVTISAHFSLQVIFNVYFRGIIAERQSTSQHVTVTDMAASPCRWSTARCCWICGRKTWRNWLSTLLIKIIHGPMMTSLFLPSPAVL